MHNRSTGAVLNQAQGILLVATEDNVVHAIDSVSGQRGGNACWANLCRGRRCRAVTSLRLE